jgi:hypothetical protein
VFISFHDQTRDEEREKLDKIKKFNFHSGMSIENSKKDFTVTSSNRELFRTSGIA